MPNLNESLIDMNPWWKGDLQLYFKPREIYEEIQKYIPLRQIIAFTGLRRVGKTTLLMKIIEDTIKKGFDPKRIIYFSFDEFRTGEIKDILKAYDEIMGQNFKVGNYVLVMDEVQKLSDWENQIKIIYDLYKDIKIILSGSESLFIRKKSKETLGGRLFEFKVNPLNFREFLSFKGKSFEPPSLYDSELSRLFREFILTQGFPELVDVSDKGIIKKYIKESIVEKAIYRDIPQIYKINDVQLLESLLNIFMYDPGEITEISELAKELSASRQTISQYLSYLEETFLLRKVYNFARSRRKVERKLKKYYPTILAPELLFRDDENSKSKVWECLVVNQLNTEFFWRDVYKNEVDIITQEMVPIEVKYGKITIDGLIHFMKQFNVEEGYVISPKREEEIIKEEKKIHVTKAYFFFLKR
jgi:predicted AAA+ superfamily ATPase